MCLINYPCKEIPFYILYNIESEYINIHVKNHSYLNVPIQNMINIVKKSIDNNQAVWCGIDWDKFNSRKYSYLDQKGFDYVDIFGFNNVMEKCDGLNYRLSYPSHAVIIRGYNFSKNNENIGFLIENSHGDNNSEFKGNYHMSLEWFKSYVYEIVVNKQFLIKTESDSLKKKPIMLPYWSPFSNLLNK